MILAQLSWPEIESTRSRVCVVPLGSLEQHGPHLPLWTDTAIVSAIASRIEQRLADDVLLAPTQPVGYSPHHSHFGCLSLDMEGYMAVIKGLCRSFAAMGFHRVLLLNGHGGNEVPCRAALCEIKVEIPELRVVLASYWALAAEAFGRIRTSPPGGMNHACEMESSVMLALYPEQVNLAAAQDDGPLGRGDQQRFDSLPPSPLRRLPDMLRAQPYYMVRNFDELSATGTVGSPSHASREKGDQFLNAAVDAVAALVQAFAAGNLDFAGEETAAPPQPHVP
ncbi:MAG TPA: creatininase family protein [Bryocella sp.]|nr:creatininase family protein [Bryocella sp.]